MMQDLWASLGLVLVLEGVLYALFPARVISLLRGLPEISPSFLRLAGVGAVAIGAVLYWFVRG